MAAGEPPKLASSRFDSDGSCRGKSKSAASPLHSSSRTRQLGPLHGLIAQFGRAPASHVGDSGSIPDRSTGVTGDIV